MESEITEYIFEIKEELTDQFYLGIMDLLKKRHDGESTDSDIIEYLLDNVEKVNTTLLKNIKDLVMKPHQNKNLTSITITGLMATLGLFTYIFHLFNAV